MQILNSKALQFIPKNRVQFGLKTYTPMGRSYAREIAERYGISFEQLTASLQARNQIPPEQEQSQAG